MSILPIFYIAIAKVSVWMGPTGLFIYAMSWAIAITIAWAIAKLSFF